MAPPRKRGAVAKAERAAMLANLEEDIAKCRESAVVSSSLVGLLALKSRLLGIDAPPPPPKRRRSKRTGDHLADHLTDLRAILDTALERGSVDAAARLTKQIRDTISQIEQREERRKQELMDGMSEEQVVESLVGAVMDLPLPLRLRVAQAIAA